MIEEIYIPPVTQCCCAWTDLLGFSELYKKYKWSLSALVKDYKKLGTPYVKGYVHFDRLYKMLIMTYHTIDPIIEKAIFINDGFARNVDVCGPVTHPFPLLSWFRETIFKHEHYCSHGHQSDFPGVRTVVTFGERTDFGFDTANVSDYAGKEIKNDEIVIYSPRHFQNNLAFAKAYLIETTVSKCRNWKVQSDYFIERDFIYFLIEHLDGKYFIVDNYYEFSDRESKEAILKDEPIKILFQVQGSLNNSVE